MASSVFVTGYKKCRNSNLPNNKTLYHYISLQETQSDAAGKLSQSIYIVESLLGKCHEEGDLLFFTIRADSQVSQNYFFVIKYQTLNSSTNFMIISNQFT